MQNKLQSKHRKQLYISSQFVDQIFIIAECLDAPAVKTLWTFKFQIGLGDFVPGTQIEKNTDVDERQANQMKLYVSFLYLLGDLWLLSPQIKDQTPPVTNMGLASY